LRDFKGLQIQDDPIENVKQKAKVFAALITELKRKPASSSHAFHW
jgi:hypothetical protein